MRGGSGPSQAHGFFDGFPDEFFPLGQLQVFLLEVEQGEGAAGMMQASPDPIGGMVGNQKTAEVHVIKKDGMEGLEGPEKFVPLGGDLADGGHGFLGAWIRCLNEVHPYFSRSG